MKLSTKIYIKIPEKTLSNEYPFSKMNYIERDEDLSASADFIIHARRVNEKAILREIYKVLGGIK